MSYPARLLQAVSFAVFGALSLSIVMLTAHASAEPGDNTPPTAVADYQVTPQDTPVVIDVLANDVDPDEDTLVIAPGAIARGAILSQAPVLFWECYPLGGGAVVVDRSGLGTTGIIGEGVQQGAGTGDCAGGTAFLFPADPAAVVSANAPSIPTGAVPRTVVVRFRANLELAGGVGLFSMGTNAVGNGQFSVARDWANDQVIFSAWGNDTVVPLPAGANLADGQEHTLAMTYDGATTITAYLDGVAGAPATLWAPLDTAGDSVLLGQTLYGAIGAGDQLRQFAVYQTALDGAAIAAIHEAIEAGAQGLALTQPAHGTATTDGATVTYTPAPGFFGTDSFTYSITDGYGGVASATVTVDVTAGVVANPDFATVITGDTLVFDPLANDVLPAGVTVSIVAVGTPANGSATTDGATIEYVPDAGFVGTDTFEYTLETSEAVFAYGEVTVTVTPDNSWPTAIDDYITTPLDQSVHIDVLANDSDPDGHDLWVSPGQLARGAILRQGPLLHWECLPEGGTPVLVDTSGNGRNGTVGSAVSPGALTGDCDNGTAMVFAGPDGVVTLANPGLPTGQQARSALVRYKANNTSAPADIPLFGYGANGIPFSQFTVSRTVLGNDKLIFTSWANDLHFDLPPGSNIADGQEHNIMFVYDGDVTVYAYYDGIPSGQGTLHTPLTTIDDTVMLGHSPWGWQGAGDEMRQFAIFPVAITEDDAYLVHAAIEAAVLNRSYTEPRFGTVIEDPDHLGFTYIPDEGYTGPDQFMYAISDGHGGGAYALVTIDVTPGVAANDDEVETDAETAVVIDVLANDSAQPGAVLTIDSVTAPAHGTAVIDGDTIVYTPDEGFLGTDTFAYTVTSDLGGDGTATVAVLVGGSGANQAPVAVDDEGATTAGSPVLIDVLANDTDPDGDDLVIAAGESAIPAVLAYAPVLHWACLPAGGSDTLFDQTGNGRDGLVSAGVLNGPASPDCGGGTALVFPDGSASVSRATPGLPEGAAPRSVMIRYRSDFAGPGDVGLFGLGTNALGLGQFSVARTGLGNDKLVFASWGNDAVLQLPAGVDIADGVEHTIVVVYDGASTLTAYVDGVAGTPAAIAPLNTVDGTVVLGQTLYGAVSAGAEMRHFAVFDRALDGAEVAGLHAAIQGGGGGAAFTQPSHGTVVQDGSALLYTPTPGFSGVDSFTYSISDGKGGSASATVVVTVTGSGAALAVADDEAFTQQGQPVGVDVLANDTGDGLTIDSVTQGANGTVTTDGETVTYTPAPGFWGVDTFTVTVSDGEDTQTGTVTVTVNGRPVGGDLEAETDLDEPVTIDVLATVVDPEGGPLAIASVTAPANGSVAVEGGEVTYTPAEGFTGLDVFTVTVEDEDGGSLVITVTVDVQGNQSPVAVADSATTGAGLSVDIDVLANDFDPDGDSLAIAPAADAIGTLNAFTPAIYWACLPESGAIVPDQSGNSLDGTIQGNVLAGSAAGDCGGATPVFADGSALILNASGAGLPSGTAPRTVVVRFRSNLGDPANVGLFGYGTNALPLGQFSIARTSAGNDRLVFASWGNDNVLHLPPGTNIADGAEHTIAVTYDGANSITAWVDGVPGIPTTIAPLDTVNSQVMLGQTLYGAISAGAEMRHFAIYHGVLDAGSLQAIHQAISGAGSLAFTQPAHGSVAPSGNGLTYTPAPGFTGVDTFTYSVTDGLGGFAAATVTVSVEGTPLAVEDDSAFTQQDQPVTVAVLDNDEGADLEVSAVTDGAQGTVTTDGVTVTYTPAPGSWGTDTFTVTVSDGAGTATSTVTVTVNGAPQAQNVDLAMQADDPAITVPWAAAASDPEGGALHVAGHTQPAFGTVTLTPGGDLSFDPLGQSGTASFQVTIEDEDGGTTVITVAVVMNGSPAGANVAASTGFEEAVEVDMLAGLTDPDGDALAITGVTPPSNGTAQVVGGSVLYTPADGFSGTDSFAVTVEDGNGGTLTLIVTVEVGPNTAPTGSDLAAATQQDTAVDIDILAGVVDAEGDELAITGTTDPANGTVEVNGGAVTYSPAPGFAGTDTFEVTVADEHGAEVTLTVTVVVNGAPAGGDLEAETTEDAPVDIDLLALASDPDGDDLEVVLVTDPAHGSVTVLNGVATYTPGAGFAGTDAFDVTVEDGNGGSHTFAVTVTVTAAPRLVLAQDACVAVVVRSGSASFLSEFWLESPGAPSFLGLTNQSPAGTLVALGTYPTGTELVLSIHVTNTGHVFSTGTAANNPDGRVHVALTPGEDDLLATVGFEDQFNGGDRDFNDAILDVIVIDCEVEAEDDEAETPAGQPVTVDVLANDEAEHGTLAVASVTDGEHGTVTTDGETVTYTPAAGFVGTDTFTYTAQNDLGGSATAEVTLTVKAASISKGKMTGGGQYRKQGFDANWGFELRCSNDEKSQFNLHLEDIKLHVNQLTFDSLTCLDNPTINNRVHFDTVELVGHGRAQLHNRRVDVVVEATLVDGGGNRSNDSFHVRVTTTAGEVLADFSGALTGGNHVAHKK